jgi:glycosyltransferase involved in cell wall biosynthesis
VEIPGVRYVRNDHDRGKGHAIRVGCAHARAPVTAQIDADLQFLPEELPELVAPIERGEADVTLGTRFAPSSTRRPGSAPLFRSLGNRAASAYASLLFGQRMTDVQAGMKAWTTRAMELIAFESDGYSYEVEIPARALLAGLRVVEVPISTDPRAGGTTKVNVLLDGARLAWDMSRFRARAWWTARANRGRM